MPTAILLNPNDILFAFEHMMSTRRYFAVMSPLNRFAALPYLLDPAYDTNVPASVWHINHQKSHTDFARSLPSNYNAPADEVGLPTAQPLADANLGDEESRTLWTFLQHREHYLADAAILPLLSGTWPFW